MMARSITCDALCLHRCIWKHALKSTLAEGYPGIWQVALTGTEFEADLDGKVVPPYTSVAVEAGAVLTVSKVRSWSSPCP